MSAIQDVAAFIQGNVSVHRNIGICGINLARQSLEVKCEVKHRHWLPNSNQLIRLIIDHTEV